MTDRGEHDDREPVLVSACLLGCKCRYDGGSNEDETLLSELAAAGRRPVSFCPEERGGLPTPRTPAWIEREGAGAVLEGRARVLTDEGRDVTEAFLEGARKALEACRALGATRAYLKERSPSCGVENTHIGGELTTGRGVTAELLAREGIQVSGVEGRRGASPPRSPGTPGS